MEELNKPSTKILVSSDSFWIEELWIKWKIQSLLIWKNKLSWVYNSNFSWLKFNKLNDNKFEIYYLNTKENSVIEIPSKNYIFDRLFEYFQKPKEIEEKYIWSHARYNNEYFDCWDFIYYLKWWNKWIQLNPVKFKEWNIWDVFFTYDPEKISNTGHFFIKIYDDLYISKLWSLPIIVTNLEEIVKICNWKIVISIEINK